jgi:hypothetical protein
MMPASDNAGLSRKQGPAWRIVPARPAMPARLAIRPASPPSRPCVARCNRRHDMAHRIASSASARAPGSVRLLACLSSLRCQRDRSVQQLAGMTGQCNTENRDLPTLLGSTRMDSDGLGSGRIDSDLAHDSVDSVGVNSPRGPGPRARAPAAPRAHNAHTHTSARTARHCCGGLAAPGVPVARRARLRLAGSKHGGDYPPTAASELTCAARRGAARRGGGSGGVWPTADPAGGVGGGGGGRVRGRGRALFEIEMKSFRTAAAAAAAAAAGADMYQARFQAAPFLLKKLGERALSGRLGNRTVVRKAWKPR